MRSKSPPGAAPPIQGRTQHRRRALDPGREPLPSSVEDTPPLPDAYGAALDDGLQALGLALDPAARAAIDGHVRLLLAWNRAINLTAIDDPVRAATAHVIDSLSAVGPLRERGVDRFLDLGSGAGFPGLPLAVVLPAARALLVDSVGKKVRFLETAATAIGMTDTVEAFAGRSEALAADARHRERWPAVTARAVAALADLVELAFPLLRPGGVLLAWKRGALDSEIGSAEGAMRALGGGRLEAIPVPDVLPDHRLIVVTKQGRTNPSYPRDPGARRRAPW